MYSLTDTFNNRLISRHRTILAAVIAETKHLRAVRRANGQNSYLTYSVRADDGRDIRVEVESARVQAHYKGF